MDAHGRQNEDTGSLFRGYGDMPRNDGSGPCVGADFPNRFRTEGRSTRWCPRCNERSSGETFSLLHDAAYITDGRRRARIYEHAPCRAIVIAVLR